MSYVDGFIVAVSASNKDKYRQHASDAALVFRKHGALQVIEAWGDDVPEGKVTSFPMAVKCAEGEIVVFSWILWPSKQAREEGWKKVMNEMSGGPDEMPFDGKRMIYGGFEIFVDA